MKVVILAGGYGTRISEESHLKPKPMIEIGGRPILWHIMKIYSTHGVNEFVICCGYKGYMIKEYFANYFLHMADVTFDLPENKMTVHQNFAEPWKVTLVDTGLNTMTGGRLKRIKPYVDNEPFCMTYGDGVANIDIKALIEFHSKQKTAATVTSVKLPARFGVMAIEDEKVTEFQEKIQGDSSWVNGGFFVLEPSVLDLITDDTTVFERKPLEELAKTGQLSSFKHTGFWQPMDTLREKTYLEDLWLSGKAPWKIWD